MSLSSRAGNRSGEQGASLVEFAIIAPLLFLLLFGVIEFGRMIAVYTGVSTAAREGARFGTTLDDNDSDGAPNYVDCEGIRAAAKAKSVLVPLQDSDITITYDDGPTENPVASCASGNPSEDDVPDGSRIVVHISTTFESPVPIISNFIGTLNVTAEQARSIFKGVTVNG